MSFKIFPAWVTPDGRKVPLIKGWQEQATNDVEQIALWQNLFREKLQLWGIPCGPANGILVLDFDAKDGGLETLQTVSLPPTLCQKTRSGGWHFFFRYPTDGRTYGNRVKFRNGTDIRGVGGWAAFYGFVDANAPIAEAPGWLLEEAIKAPTAVSTGPALGLHPEQADKVIQESLDRIRDADPGESNNTLNLEAFKLGQLVAGGTITRDYAENALFRAAKARGKPDYEARATITSGIDGGLKRPVADPFGTSAPVPTIQIPPPPGPPPRWTPERFTRADLLNTSNLKKPQLFENWSTEDIAITTADGGTGKTTLMLSMAVSLALGQPFLGFRCVQPGKTLYIIGEDSPKKYAAILGVMIRQMGLLENFPGFAEKVQLILDSIIIKKDPDLCLIVKERSTGFIQPNTESMRKVLEAVEDIKPKLIVFDPIASFWGQESALNDMNRAVIKFMSELVERSGASVEMINHMGKSSSASKDMTQFAGRGGTGLPSNARVSRVLRPIFEEEYAELTGESLADKQSAMMCVVNKFTDGSPLYNKPFLILRDGYSFKRRELSSDKARDMEKVQADTERVFTFVKSERNANKYPTLPVVIGHFMTCGNPLSESRTKRALQMLQYTGHMGEFIRTTDNPNVTIKDKVYIVVDAEGKEH